jgi:hypothetical protein
MAIRYICCHCDADMTDSVKTACDAGPDLRTMLTFKGMELVHFARSVTLTCPNNHACSYPCAGPLHE